MLMKKRCGIRSPGLVSKSQFPKRCFWLLPGRGGVGGVEVVVQKRCKMTVLERERAFLTALSYLHRKIPRGKVPVLLS